MCYGDIVFDFIPSFHDYPKYVCLLRKPIDSVYASPNALPRQLLVVVSFIADILHLKKCRLPDDVRCIVFRFKKVFSK